VEGIPLKSRNSKELAGAILSVFTRYGSPRRLRSDREFLSDAVGAVCEAFGVTRVTTAAYHPAANGQSERRNQDVKAALERTLGDDECWDYRLENVLLGIRATPSRRHGLSPHEVIFGEKLRLPLEMSWKVSQQEDAVADALFEEIDYANFIKGRSEEFKHRWELVRSNLKRYEEARQDKQTNLRIGELVLARNFGRKKGDSKWIGPFLVLEVADRHVTVKNVDGHPRVLTLADVKRWHFTPQTEEPVGDESVVPHGIEGDEAYAEELVTRNQVVTDALMM